MPRYFFDWECVDQVEADRGGMTLPDAASAVHLATECAIELVTDDLRHGDPNGLGAIRVRDEQGQCLHRISLSAARELAVLACGLKH